MIFTWITKGFHLSNLFFFKDNLKSKPITLKYYNKNSGTKSILPFVFKL